MSVEHLFTPLQKKILTLLGDGLPHTKQEIHLRCLAPSNIKQVKVNIAALRIKLEPKGQTIVCELRNRKTHYRWVRLIGTGE